MMLSGWGRFPVLETNVTAPRSLEALRETVRAHPRLIARGNGRAYGDSAIYPAATVETRHLNRMIAFDTTVGQLIAEPGVLMKDTIATFLPRGWFPLVSPGTKFVSLGGAIAADVHGKNHHKDGSFRSCVDWIDVMNGAGEVSRCSREQNPDLFDHTLGGMGLTGIITKAAIRLRPVETAWIRQKTHAAPNLKAAMEFFEANEEATYSVAWIDCLARGGNTGRSLVMTGEHAAKDDLTFPHKKQPLASPRKSRVTVPFDFPSFALNQLSVAAFNELYYRVGARKKGVQLVDWDSYFYPLDAILHWNRVYGRNGFAQFQCVLPLGESEIGLTNLLEAISKEGAGSFLAVLKRFGKQTSPFSFPMEGYTLALDFPVNTRTLALLETLDRITLEHGGRFYLAKDSRMSAQTFHASDGRVKNFKTEREANQWQSHFVSAQSERLDL